MAIARQLVFSMSIDEDKLNVGGFYSWNQIVDGNATGSVFSCAYCPAGKASNISMIQSRVFLGTMSSDSMLQTFHEGKTLDGEEEVNAYMITNMIAPSGKDPDEGFEMCRFINLEMTNINALSRGVVVEYSIDAEAPHQISPMWEATHYDTGNNRVFFPRAVGRWIHLKITDESGLANRDAWGAFMIGYYPLGTRDSEASS